MLQLDLCWAVILLGGQELPDHGGSALEWVKIGCLWWPECPDNESIHKGAAGCVTVSCAPVSCLLLLIFFFLMTS